MPSPTGSPAPDLPTLMDFETQFEAQTAVILDATGISAAITQIRAASNVPTLDIAYQFEIGQALNHFSPTPSGKYLHDMFDGVLTITVFANRDDDANPNLATYEQFASLRRQIAAAFVEGTWPFNTVGAGLAYLDTRSFFMRPTARRAGQADEKMQDLVVMSWHVRFGIAKSSWPTAS